MSILEQLRRPTFKVSKSDKILMNYLQKNIQSVSHTAIAQMAEESGIGVSTITRFVKKMGFANLQTFKVALAQELTDSSRRYIINRDIASNEPVMVTARKLLDTNIGMLEKTIKSLRSEDIERSSILLRQAGRIYFIGLGNSGYMAQDSNYKFCRIGLNCMGFDNSHMMIMMASLFHSNDLVVAISHSGDTVEIIKTVELARENGARVIVITANKESKLVEISDVHIFYEARETLLETGSISAKLAQFFIMDLIYTQVVKEMADVAAENKQKTALAINLLR
jgi:DNA-binding MurR/RpiR family transcriptional regulator